MKIPRKLHGRADIKALNILENGLKIDPDDTPPRHANIIDWPPASAPLPAIKGYWVIDILISQKGLYGYLNSHATKRQNRPERRSVQQGRMLPVRCSHIIVRGVERRKIFWDDEDRDPIVKRLGKVQPEHPSIVLHGRLSGVDRQFTACCGWAVHRSAWS
jgi:hypothetical protein